MFYICAKPVSLTRNEGKLFLVPKLSGRLLARLTRKVCQVIIMRHVAESVRNPKKNLRRPRESDSRKQQLRRQAVTQVMISSTFRTQHNTYTE